MENKRAFKLLLTGVFSIAFSLTHANVQAQQKSPKKVAKKHISTEQLIPLLDFIFSNKISVKDTTVVKENEPLTGITWREVLKRAS